MTSPGERPNLPKRVAGSGPSDDKALGGCDGCLHQKMTVEHIHVHAGAQAVVRNLTKGLTKGFSAIIAGVGLGIAVKEGAPKADISKRH